MKVAICKLKSASPYSQGRHYSVDKLPKELPKDYEARTWRERMHVTPEGFVYIPAMQFKNSLEAAAKYSGKQIAGKGKSTYTKHFEAGVMVLEHLVLPIKKDDVTPEWLFVPSDGIRGSGKRVEKCFPLIQSWEGTVEFTIFDETITEDVFTDILTESGKFIGIGRWRPRNAGLYGRFSVESVKWK